MVSISKELEFRAIILEQKSTIYFNLIDLIDPGFTIREILIPWLQAGNKPDRFIGTHDKNGTAIFETDEVRLPMWFSRDDPARGGYWHEGVIVYKNYGFIVESEDDGFYDNMGILFSWDELEIIGDTHRNPELMEVNP